MKTHKKKSQLGSAYNQRFVVVMLAVLSLTLQLLKAFAEEKEVKPVNFVKVTDEGDSAGRATASEKSPMRPELYPEGALRQAYDFAIS